MQILVVNYTILINQMQQKLSYLNINAKDLKALYKYYYIKKLTNNITKVGNSFEKEVAVMVISP